MSGNDTVSTNHFRTQSFLQKSTDVHISDNSQKLLANTSAHFERKTDTNTKYMPSSSFFPRFLLLANWTLSCPAHHLFSDPPGHTFRSSQPRGLNIAYALPEPTLLCIQQSPQAPYQNITAYWGHNAARHYKSFPVWTDLQISQLSKLKATDSLI